MAAPETVYELKLKGRGKVTVQLSPMGVVVTEKKKPPTTHLYQTLTSWGQTPRGFEIQPAGGKTLDFTSTAEEAEAICDGMTEKAVSLAKAAKEQRKAEKKAKSDEKALVKNIHHHLLQILRQPLQKILLLRYLLLKILNQTVHL